jgi:putative FmdB family regulatory protein
MPVYEYICQACGQKYDKFVRSSLAQVETICPKCGSTQAKKAFSVFGTRGVGSSSSAATASSGAACGPVG